MQHNCHPAAWIWNLFCTAAAVGVVVGTLAFFMIYGEVVMDPKGYADRRMKAWAIEIRREQARMLEDE